MVSLFIIRITVLIVIRFIILMSGSDEEGIEHGGKREGFVISHISHMIMITLLGKEVAQG
ncbi:hypothetical protein GCM10020331_070150 [Ectobacillus funiculus]